MKKSMFNKSTVALAAGLFAACAANAYVTGAGAYPAVIGTIAAADTLRINPLGLGHSLFVPYYSAQNGNRTYLTITNTDMRNGKAVKVRFRGAANSDDVLDFTLFLSPGDAWTGVVSAPSAANSAQIETVEGDTSCTAPAIPTGGAVFRSFRLHPYLTPGLIASETREGYIEIFNEADIPPSASAGTGVAPTLYQAITHVAGVPVSCAAVTSTSGGALSTVDPAFDPRAVLAATTSIQAVADADIASTYATAQGKGFEVPTTGLMANWAIVNPGAGRSWSGAAVAVEAQVSTSAPAFMPGYGNIVYHPQRPDVVLTDNTRRQGTSDPLLRGGALDNNVAPTAVATDPNPFINNVAAFDGTTTGVPAAGTAAIRALAVDLPDMSTPYLWASIATLANGEATRVQTQNLTSALAVESVSNEILTRAGGSTDWSFSFPTRRYNVARAYPKPGSTPGAADSEATGRTFYTDLRIRDDGTAIAAPVWGNFFNTVNIVSETAIGRRHQLCVNGIQYANGAKGGREEQAAGGASSLNRHSGVTADRDESFAAASSSIDFSPAPPAGTPAAFCGEAGVFSFNNAVTPTTVLSAQVDNRDFSTSGRTFGWMRFQTLGLISSNGAIAAQPAATLPLAVARNAATDGNGLPVVGFSFMSLGNLSIALPHRGNK